MSQASTATRARQRWRVRRVLVPFAISAILHVVPWWRLVLTPGWPTGVVIVATVVAGVLVVGLPVAMVIGRTRGRETQEDP